MKKTKVLVITSLLVALTVIFARFLSVKTDVVRISLEFAPIALSSILFGPVIGGITGLISDIIGATLFPSGTFFPGFTISAFITGLIYGLFLYKKQLSFIRIVFAVFTKVIVIDLLLVTTWLIILYHIPLQSLIIARIIKCVIEIPIEVVILYFAIKPIYNHYTKLN